jgi:two-component system LytT family sensor kinase
MRNGDHGPGPVEERSGLFPSGAWLVIPISCAFIALLYTGQTYLKMSTHGHSFVRIFFWQLVVWGFWGVLTPIIVRLTRNFPPAGEGRIRALAVHAAASVVLGVLHLLPVAVATDLIDPYAPIVVDLSFRDQFTGMVISWIHVDVLLYWATMLTLHFYNKLRMREMREARLEAQLARAQLESLKLQIRPHFLFNSLNAIAGLVRTGENAAAVKMIAGLSELLRYVLKESGADQQVSLGDELAFLRRYLEIQQTRFGDRLVFDIEAEPEITRAAFPSLLLQPLAENAVEHGVASVALPCEIAVRARREGERVVVSIEDNGPGLAGDVTRGVGLSNCESRLRSLYGDRARLRINPREGGGVSVLVEVPYELKPA